MSEVVRKICPITKSDVIIITYPNPEELVVTQRKATEGKYEKVMKARKEFEVACPSQGHPAIDIPSSIGIKLMKEGKAWCRKTKNVCPMEQIIQDLL